VTLYERQTFLGSRARLSSATVAIVGLGGGGSHIIQQLAHLGVGHLVGIDHDRAEDSNLNRSSVPFRTTQQMRSSKR
jgi:tRNA A37 threonylcarbamoyladenosine dehydratase